DGLDNDCNGKVDDGVELMHDSKTCGGCGIVCPAGVACQLGRCPGGTTMMADAGVPPGRDGGVVGPGGMLGICSVNGSSVCVDFGQDQANCGTCGHACSANQYCGGGVCMDPPAI